MQRRRARGTGGADLTGSRQLQQVVAAAHHPPAEALPWVHDLL